MGNPPPRRGAPRLLYIFSTTVIMYLTGLLLWTFSAGGKLFAYQSGVLVLGYSYGYFEARDLVRIGGWLTVAEFLILLLLVPFYWPSIGIY